MANMKTREGWLHEAADLLSPLLAEHGVALPGNVKLSVGFAKGSARAIGQCWQQGDDEEAARENTHVFVCPTLGQDVHELVGVLLHELVHAGVGNKCGHRGEFARVMRALGFEGKLTTTTLAKATVELVEAVEAVVARLGPYPHKPLARKVPKKPEQSTHLRMYSVTLDGYRVNIARTCLEEHGRPVDPTGEKMVTGEELKAISEQV